MPAFVDTGLNLVHVDDVAQGHLLALDKGQIGENYILGGADVSLQTMLGDIAFLSGRRAPTIKLPRGAALSRWPMARKPSRGSPARSRSSPPMRCRCRAITCSFPPPRPKRELGYTRAALYAKV